MIVYHGTAFENLDSVLKTGLLPARDSGKCNWKSFEYELTETLTYVTDVPFQYAANASYLSGKGVVFELDIDDSLLYPDPRVITAKHTDLMHYSPNVWKELISEESMVNLAKAHKHLIHGKEYKNYCCLSAIPASAIKKYIIIDYKERKSMMDLVMQEGVSHSAGFSVVKEMMENEKWQERMPFISPDGLELVEL